MQYSIERELKLCTGLEWYRGCFCGTVAVNDPYFEQDVRSLPFLWRSPENSRKGRYSRRLQTIPPSLSFGQPVELGSPSGPDLLDLDPARVPRSGPREAWVPLAQGGSWGFPRKVIKVRKGFYNRVLGYPRVTRSWNPPESGFCHPWNSPGEPQKPQKTPFLGGVKKCQKL